MFEEWKAFDELEPDPQLRTDAGFAHVVQALMREGKPLKDYMLAFGDYPTTQAVVTQSVEYQEKLIDAWIIGSNAIFEAKAKRA